MSDRRCGTCRHYDQTDDADDMLARKINAALSAASLGTLRGIGGPRKILTWQDMPSTLTDV